MYGDGIVRGLRAGRLETCDVCGGDIPRGAPIETRRALWAHPGCLLPRDTTEDVAS